MKPLDQHAAHCVAHHGHSMCTCGIEDGYHPKDIENAQLKIRREQSDFWPGFFSGALCAVFWMSVIWGLS